MANEVNPERLQEITSDMIAALSAPAFVKAMYTMKKTPDDRRIAVAKDILAPATLRAQGVPLPKGMRVTSRYFEPGNPTVITVNDEGATTSLGEEAPIIGAACGCACGGAATVCGGAGGGE